MRILQSSITVHFILFIVVAILDDPYAFFYSIRFVCRSSKDSIFTTKLNVHYSSRHIKYIVVRLSVRLTIAHTYS